ncbi:MAG: hypothetical protein A4E52_02104 [Pelotomaculum sp. PtaB.Bin013]|uniref:Uncharacterized protein n=1 Tax=Pelotomaculum isophthalicicum JI TaxID=947010 RepID=A0A9X4JU98_9FIRM|nr:hypothetical protein [Pelotomaculum isophthalicicum]MDF9408755.1 hypothetical protein [Pelotomaculum isophthalicicum JI]OPX82116.1 MAG: hypothetical protein A4E52_02104 [Pelotomaculum sp. PtaB.Bin013]
MKEEKNNSNDNAILKQKSPKLTVQDVGTLTQQTHHSNIIQRVMLSPSSLSSVDILQLQRTIGNQAVDSLLKGIIQHRSAFEEDANIKTTRHAAHSAGEANGVVQRFITFREMAGFHAKDAAEILKDFVAGKPGPHNYGIPKPEVPWSKQFPNVFRASVKQITTVLLPWDSEKKHKDFGDWPDLAQFAESKLTGESDSDVEFEIEEKQDQKESVTSTGVLDIIRGALGLAKSLENSVFGQMLDKNTPYFKRLAAQFPHYVKQLDTIINLLESGAVSPRWLTLPVEGKIEVARRIALAMRTLGDYILNKWAEKKVIEDETELPVVGGLFKEGEIAIIHGSYLFGASDRQPGDIDTIANLFGKNEKVSADLHLGPRDKSVESSVFATATRTPKDDKLNVSPLISTLDEIVGVPLWGDIDNFAMMEAGEVWDEIGEDVGKLIDSAASDDDPGKFYRKVINIATVLNYLSVRIIKKDDKKLLQAIWEANAMITSGSKKNDKKLAEEAAGLLGYCKKLYEEIAVVASKL